MANPTATWAAFGLLVTRRLTTATCTRKSAPFCNVGLQASSLFRQHRTPQEITHECAGRRRYHSTSHHRNSHQQSNGEEKGTRSGPRKASRAASAAGASPLRRVAVEAQRSQKLIKGSGKRAHVDPEIETKEVTAFCAAESYKMQLARQLLVVEGYMPDPYNTGLYPQVLHFQTPNFVQTDPETREERPAGHGDVFVFPSGSVVGWNVPENLIHRLVHRVLTPAAENGHLNDVEVEDLQYVEDRRRETSKIVGDTIILGIKADGPSIETGPTLDEPPLPQRYHASIPTPASDLPTALTVTQKHDGDIVLAKIAFSSALARSAKLAVLENRLEQYFDSTRNIPAILSTGRKLRFTRAFILRKTGELLSIRAQLNLYSELTDSLPDLFWDSPYELGLEGYYEMVGQALDVQARIKVLNERMDYAKEIAEVLRERLSEKHSTGLEWLIIGLISIEVGFEIMHLWRERNESLDPYSNKALWSEWLQRELAKKSSDS